MKIQDIIKVVSFDTFIPFFYPALMLPLKSSRKNAIETLSFKPGDKVLIPGIGSGHDLPFIPKDVTVEGVDISDVMVGIGKLKSKVAKREENVTFKIMDAERLEFPDNHFDKAILSLFLTVVYDPKKSFSEIVRVLKPEGEILIFDHLLREGQVPPAIAKPIDAILSYGFASVTRVLDEIIEGHPVKVVKELPGDPIGFVKGFILTKS